MSILELFVEGRVKAGISSVIENKLDDVIFETLEKRIKKEPYNDLSEFGFRWAWFFCLRDKWPSVDNKTAQEWLDDYIGCEFEDPSMGWSYLDAKQLVKDFVSEFGEHT